MLLKVEQIEYEYEKNKPLFSDVSFCLDKGEILTILGPNGIGKSTLLNCIANTLTPLSGSIKVENKDIVHMSMKEIAQLVGYVSQVQNPNFVYTVKEYVVMGRAAYLNVFAKPQKHDYDLVKEVLSDLDIIELIDKDIDKLSGGQRQQVALARVLVQQPKIIILDEPTSYLDFGNQYKTIEFIKLLSRKGYAIILTTHVPEHAFLLGGKVAILDRNNNFLIGETKNIITENLLRDIYDCDLKVLYVDEIKRQICTYAKEIL